MVLRLPLLLLLLSATLALQPTRPHAASAPLLLSTALRAQAPSEGQPAPIAANPWAALSAQLVETELVPDQALGLRERPGYAFGLGSDRWSASRYEGTVEGWSGQSVNWVSRSLLRRAAVTEDDSAAAVAADSTSGVGTVVAALDMNFYVTPVFDVPHARLTATSTADRHLLCVDYLPRVELATNMDYFDRYFQGVEEAMLVETAAAAAACGVAPMAAPDTVLSRMLLSPFALRIQVRFTHCLEWRNVEGKHLIDVDALGAGERRCAGRARGATEVGFGAHPTVAPVAQPGHGSARRPAAGSVRPRRTPAKVAL